MKKRHPELNRGVLSCKNGAGRGDGGWLAPGVGAAFAVLAAGTGGAADVLFAADFEAPLYHPGNIHGQNGWTVEQGLAEVDAKAGRGGGGALVMRPSNPFSQATLRLEAPETGSPVFMDFYVLPVASWQEEREEMLDIDGARIGFFRSREEPAAGRFWLFHGDGKGEGAWQETGAVLPVDARTGRPAQWVRLTLREDLSRQAWDLWVNENLSGYNVGFQEVAGLDNRSYVIMGDAVEHLALDDLTVGRRNPLAPDADGDGVPDADELLIGSNPLAADRDAVDASGAVFHDKWVKLLAERQAAAAGTPEAPVFSVAPGLASSPFQLAVSASGGRTIYYTTDGSEPDPASSPVVREEGLEISSTTVIRARTAGEDGKLSATATAAWIFPSHVAGQKVPEGWPESLATAGVRSLPLNPEVRTSGDGTLPPAQEVSGTFGKAPIVVLAVPREQLFGERGIYEKSLSPLKASGAVVWMDAETGRSGGAEQASFQISGESSRSHEVTLKHSLRVTLSGISEAGPVFGAESFPAAQFVLRNPTQDSWAVSGGQGWHRDGAKYVMDAWASRWLAEQGHPSLRHQWVHVFLNGTYWGIYDAVEQHDTAYAMRHGAGAGQHLLAPDAGGSPRAIRGSAAGWNAALEKMRILSGLGEAASDAQWEEGSATVDLEGLADYMLWNWWLGNYDWPLHNWLLSHENGKWSFLSWDAELCGNSGKADGAAQRLATDACGPGAAFTALSRWAKFRGVVSARYAMLTAENGPLSAAGALDSLSVQEKAFAPVVAAESARWGWLYRTPALSPADWAANMAVMKNDFIPGRALTVREELEAWLEQRAAESRRRTNSPPEPVEEVPAEDESLKDSDGDGIPDVWERRFGLDPFNPGDAMEDTDGDGLNNFEEFLRRSDPRNKDTLTMLDENSPGLHGRFSARQATAPAAPPATDQEPAPDSGEPESTPR